MMAMSYVRTSEWYSSAFIRPLPLNSTGSPGGCSNRLVASWAHRHRTPFLRPPVHYSSLQSPHSYGLSWPCSLLPYSCAHTSCGSANSVSTRVASLLTGYPSLYLRCRYRFLTRLLIRKRSPGCFRVNAGASNNSVYSILSEAHSSRAPSHAWLHFFSSIVLQFLSAWERPQVVQLLSCSQGARRRRRRA